MEDNNSRDFDGTVDEAEEALSLSDLPLHVEDQETFQISPHEDDDHSDQFFEFLSDLTTSSASDTIMCPADDIIFCGKLIPLTPQQQRRPEDEIKTHRRSESLSNLETYPTITRSNSSTTRNNYHHFLRTSRSLDYQKLRRFASSKSTTATAPDFDIQRSASVRSVGKADATNNKKASSWKPKWYLPMIGIVRFPPEMDLRDIKSRQFRRSSSVMFPSLDSHGNFPANRITGKDSPYSSSSSSWRFIKALSCSDHASVAVTTSLSVSHA